MSFNEDLAKGRRFKPETQAILAWIFYTAKKCIVYTNEGRNIENGICDIDIIALDGAGEFKTISLKTRDFYNQEEDATIEFTEGKSKAGFFDGQSQYYLFIRAKAENRNEMSYAYFIDRAKLFGAWKAGVIKGNVIKAGTGSFISFSYKELMESESLILKVKPEEMIRFQQANYKVPDEAKLYKLISYLKVAA